MKLQKLSALVIGGLMLGSAAHAEDVIKIGTLSDYAPFEYKDPSGKLLGMEIELGDAMCKQMKAKCQYVTMDFDALIPALKAKKIDAVLAQMSITDERKKVVDFTNLFTLAPVQYVAKKGAGITENPATLKGKIVGVQSGTNHESYLKARLPKDKSGIEMKIYQSLDQAWLDLVAGRVNAVLADTTVSYDWIAKTGGKQGFAYAGKPINDVAMFGEGTGIAVRKGDPLKEKFNAAIKQVLADGTFAKANKKVFPFSIAPGAK
ncbi:transporter substrate-binding domain-containing protein [Leeia sp. TBRC 13508]|uniref:Transporter substrate-binding domain-containing protein n=1 Tax=Leeia speluncae TaxID=2884804 RepID=A0ABS8DB74_9NEIS|nr:transporter substrate-binding domain-containing protein [Leeia speluncae]MCB6185419.1 transporter substrate-binding domain-containing protein [Leeia speluncae]